MRTTTLFQEYLSPEEVLLETGDGFLVEGRSWTDGFVGLTDRRLLFVTDDGGFTDVDYEHVCSIRSQTQQTFTERGLRLRAAAALGGLLALVASLGAVVLASSALGGFLAITVIGGVAAAEALRRTGIEVDWDAIAERLPGFDRGARIGAATDGGARADEERDGGLINQRWETEYVYAHQLLLLTAGILAVTAGIGLVALTGGLLVLALTIAAIAGLAVTDAAVRRIRRLDDAGGSRRHEREVRIELVSGRDVSVRFDSTGQTDRVLTQLASASASKRSRGLPRVSGRTEAEPTRS